MKPIVMVSIMMVIISCSHAQRNEVNTAIEGYGKIFDVPFGTDKPDPSMEYKIVAESDEAFEEKSEIYPPLDHMARAYNLHIYGGVPKEKLKVALVIFSAPVSLMVNNETYKKKFGVDNPNSGIIEAMTKAGIKIYVCGQSLVKRNIDPKTIDPNVTIAISRYTTVSTLQLKGYAMFKY